MRGEPLNPDSALFAAGNGPAYPAGRGTSSGAITRPGAVGTTQGIRLDWFVAPSYSGPVLVRGGQIDGGNDVRFSSANPANGGGFSPSPELHLTGMGDVPSGSGWRRWNTYLETTAPGCYALQMDGTSFSTIVVIEVVPG